MKQGEGTETGGGCKGGSHTSGATCAKGGGPGGMDWAGALSLLHTHLCKAGGGCGNRGMQRGSHVSGVTCMKGGVSMWGSQKWWGQLTVGTPCLCGKDGGHGCRRCTQKWLLLRRGRE